MKIIKQLFFGIVGVIIFGAFINVVIKKIVLKDFYVRPNKNILVFGDSHAECSFYDRGNEIQNFGVRSEIPALTLLKAKHLLNEKDNHKVVITLLPHNISTWHEKRFYENDSSGAKLSKYWSLLNNKYLLEHYQDLPLKTRALLHLKKTTGAPSIESSFKIKTMFKGSFYKGKDTTIVNIKEANKAFKRHFGSNYFYNTNRELSSDKLKKGFAAFIHFVNSTKSEVMVIGTPIHKNYLDLLPKEQFEEYKMFLLELKNEFPSIKILDFTELQLPDNYFLDSDHLNLKGARYFTEMVVKEINK